MFESVRECYRVLQSATECYRVLQSATKCYRVLQSATEFYRVLQSATECYRVLQIAKDKSSASTWTNFRVCSEQSSFVNKCQFPALEFNFVRNVPSAQVLCYFYKIILLT